MIKYTFQTKLLWFWVWYIIYLYCYRIWT